MTVKKACLTLFLLLPGPSFAQQQNAQQYIVQNSALASIQAVAVRDGWQIHPASSTAGTLTNGVTPGLALNYNLASGSLTITIVALPWNIQPATVWTEVNKWMQAAGIPNIPATALNGISSADQWNTGDGLKTGLNGIQQFMNSQTGGAGHGVVATVNPNYPAAAHGLTGLQYEEPQGSFASYCSAGAENGYADADLCGFPWPVNSYLVDPRDGTLFYEFNNPVNRGGGLGQNHPLSWAGTGSADAGTAELHVADFDANYGNGFKIPFEFLQHDFIYGHNTNSSLGGYGKSNGIDFVAKVVAFTEGQSQAAKFFTYKTGLGDAMGASTEIVYSNGVSDNSDEGEHHGDDEIVENNAVFRAPCVAGCTPGTQLISLARGYAQDLGDGRYVIDLTRASAGNLGAVVNGIGTGQILADNNAAALTPPYWTSPAGTFTPSTFIGSLQTNATAPPGAGTPPANTIYSIATTSGSLAPGLACISDNTNREEFFTIASVAPGSMTASFIYTHLAGSLIAQGGTCGQSIALNADTWFAPADAPQWVAGTSYSAGSIVGDNFAAYQASPGITGDGGRPANANLNWSHVGHWTPFLHNTLLRVLPLLGSADSAHTWYGGIASNAGISQKLGPTSADSSVFYRQWTAVNATYSAATGLVTLSFDSSGVNMNQMPFTVSGAPATDSGLNGTFVFTSTQSWGWSYKPTTPPVDTTIAGLTVTFNQGTFTMYPAARAISVYNSATHKVDGANIVLGVNNIPWAPGDVFEEPHWHTVDMNDTHNYYGEYMPPVGYSWGWGKAWGGLVTGDWHAADFRNNTPPALYSGYGGTTSLPSTFAYFLGMSQYDMSIYTAPNTAVIAVNGCKADTYPGAGDGCTRWDAAYPVFQGWGINGAQGSLIWDPHNLTFKMPAVNIATLTVTNCTGCGTAPSRATAIGATPTFSATATVNYLQLTANITSSTIPAGADGFCTVFQLPQNQSGGWTFTWPGNVVGGMAVSTRAGSHNSQQFCYNAANADWEAAQAGVSY